MATYPIERLPPWPELPNNTIRADVCNDITELAVGKVAFIFQGDNRVYLQNSTGGSNGSPIYRYKWVAVKIIGETKQSWLHGWGGKVLKRDNKLIGLKEVEEAIWRSGHAPNIIMRLRYGDALTVSQLKQIAEWIGYDPEKQK